MKKQILEINMYENNLRQIIAVTIVLGHLLTFSLLIVLWQLGGFLFDEMVTVFAIMTPIFATYTGLAISYIFRTATVRRRGKKVNISSAIIGILFPIIFLITVNGILVIKSYGSSLYDFQNVVKAFGLIETTFAVYLGQIINQMLSDS